MVAAALNLVVTTVLVSGCHSTAEPRAKAAEEPIAAALERMLAMRAYERGDGEMSAAPLEGWIAPYRVVRL